MNRSSLAEPQRRVLVVGGGSIGERHIRCFLATGRATVAVCEHRSDRLQQIAETYPIAGTYSDFEAIDLAQFDAVVICVYANLHVPWARRAVEAGAHVLIEKPLSNRLEGVAELEEAVRLRGRVAGVAHVRRAMRGARKIAQELASGRIGELLTLTWSLGYDHRMARPDYLNSYWRDRSLGGGAVLDFSSHCSNLIQSLLGPVRSVVAVYDHLQMEGTQCEDTVAYSLRFSRSAAIASVQCNTWQPQRTDLLTLSGTRGVMVYDGVAGRLGIAERGGAWTWTEGWTAQADAKGQVDEPFIVQANNFLDAMAGNGAVFCTLAEGRHTVEICHAILESGRLGSEVTLPPSSDATRFDSDCPPANAAGTVSRHH